MSPDEIRVELIRRRKKTNMAQIARDLKCSPTAITLVIDRKTVSSRIMIAIAEAIEQPVDDVFPEHYRKSA
jgi:lambda repressor-like predicted transcriptional regulator